MPMSAAAMNGIRAHGLRWRYQLSLHGQPERLGDEESLVVGDVLAIRDSIERDLRGFVERRINKPDEDLLMELLKQIDELECVEDDPDHLKAVLIDLYDVFDFHRVCVVA